MLRGAFGSHEEELGHRHAVLVARPRRHVALRSIGAAGLLVRAAHPVIVRAARIGNAGLPELKHAAARRGGLALLELVAHHLGGSWLGSRSRWGGRRRGRVRTMLRRVAGHLRNSADSLGPHSHLHLHVSALAPHLAPRVLHDPVVPTLLVRAVTRDQHAVIQLGAAALVREHPPSVQLKVGVVGLDRDRHGLPGDGFHECRLIVGGDVNVAVNSGDDAIHPPLVAGALRASVRVVRFSVQPVLLHELEGVVHQAALAAVVHEGVAVHELLLAQGREVSAKDRGGSLHRPRRGEGPAGAAPALVLHLGHRAALHPVHGLEAHGAEVAGHEGRGRGGPRWENAAVVGVGSEPRGAELLQGEVGQGVQTDGVPAGSRRLGVLAHAQEVGLEGREPVPSLLSRGVRLAVKVAPLPEERENFLVQHAIVAQQAVVQTEGFLIPHSTTQQRQAPARDPLREGRGVLARGVLVLWDDGVEPLALAPPRRAGRRALKGDHEDQSQRHEGADPSPRSV
mmetsp:Transcript_3279/g.11461  ORF Transcript_3279/g.11461 Transcript_3279/m.11461 type:complete len:510 (+) Transcript_3279:502-2031(+)